MKILPLALLLGLGWAATVSAQNTLVRIQAPVPETTEPAPNIRVRPGEFLISRGANGTTLGEVRVHLEYSGNATPGSDYAELPRTVTIPAGALGVTLLVEPRDDDEMEGDEVVVATLVLPLNQPSPGYAIAPDQRQARVIIHDINGQPPRPEVSVSAPSWRTGEPCPVCFVAPAVLLFERSGSTDHPLPILLHADGTATPGLDYPELPRRIEIPAGQTSIEVRLGAIDDQLAEGPEVVRIRLVPPTTAPDSIFYRINPEQSSALVVIFDDEPEAPQARLDFIAPTDGAHVPLGVPVELSVIGVWTEGEIDQGVKFYDGDQLVGNTPPSAVARPPIPGLPSVHTIRWENPAAGNHTLTATSELGPDRSVISRAIHIVIGEAPPANVVRIEATQPIAEETSAPLRRIRLDGLFTVSRTGSTEHAQPVWILYSGTSTPDKDYPALPLLVTIPAGESSIELRVEANVDDTPEPIETLVATLSNCPPVPMRAPCYEFHIDPAHQEATVYLRDDGVSQVSLDLIRPEDGSHFELGQPIHLAAIAIDLEGYISRVEFWAGGEQIGVSELHFFREPDPGTPIEHSFEWNNAPAGEHVLTARVSRDDGTRVISLPVHITVGPATSEHVVLEIFVNDPVAHEPAANNVSDPAVFTVRRSAGPLNVAVSIGIFLDGTAISGEDYEPPGSLLLRAGERSVDLVIRPRADTAAEGEETVVVYVVPPPCLPPIPPECYRVGPHSSARAVILDRSEEGESPRAVITRPVPNQVFEPGQAVSIRVEAVDPDGYVRRAEFFADGRQIGEQVLEFIQPPDPGQTHVFEFDWENPLPGPHRLTVRVTDNEGLQGTAPAVEILVRGTEPLPLLAVLVLDPFGREPSANTQIDTATFGIVRFGPSTEPLEVSYALGGMAENGVDYARLTGRVVIEAGREVALVRVAPLADNQTEGIETVILRLLESSHYQLAPNRGATAVIADRNLPQPRAHCVPLGEGARYLCFTAASGRRFRLEASNDLRTWESLFEGYAADEALHYVDDATAGRPCRFYRLVPDEGVMSREEAIFRLEMQREINNGSVPPLPPTPMTPSQDRGRPGRRNVNNAIRP